MKSESNRAPLGPIDSHFHVLELRERGIDAAQALERCRAVGFAALIDVAVDTERFAERAALLASEERVRLTAGIAPALAGAPALSARLEELERQLRDPRVVALGEIGLDRKWDYGSPGEQEELFTAQLELANRFDLPVVIHNRDADDELLALLRRTPPARGGIMHCFSSTLATARACMELGFLISFAGNVTYNSARELRSAAAGIELGAILLETDAPFLAPAPLRGRANEPVNVLHTYELVASLRGIAVPALIEAVYENFFGLFGERWS